MEIDKLMQTAGPIAGIAAVVSVIAGVIAYVVARQLSDSREELRLLRVALERDPSPGQLGQALQMFPQAAQYPQTHRIGEMVKQAHVEETKRADKVERMMGITRSFFALAALGAAIFIASIFLKPKPVAAPAPAPVATPGM